MYTNRVYGLYAPTVVKSHRVRGGFHCSRAFKIITRLMQVSQLRHGDIPQVKVRNKFQILNSFLASMFGKFANVYYTYTYTSEVCVCSRATTAG